jgi:hypothetical protein
MIFPPSPNTDHPGVKVSSWFLTLLGVLEFVSGCILFFLSMTVQASSRTSISRRATAHHRALRMVWRVADPDGRSAAGDRTALPNACAFETSLGHPCPRPDDLRWMAGKGVEQWTSPARIRREPGFGSACNSVLAYFASFFGRSVPGLNLQRPLFITERNPSLAFGACP